MLGSRKPSNPNLFVSQFMSKAASELISGGPLTVYSEDENMFRASVREFAEGEIR